MDNTDIRDDIQQAAETMRRGGLVLYPTDTVWGLGCDATNEAAVRRIFELKRRADNKALIVLIDSVDNLWRYVDEVPAVAEELLEAAVDPLTVVYDHGRGLASNLLGADGSVGIRITRERYSNALCRAMRRPVVSTSANIAGCPTPRIYAEIGRELIDGVDYVAGYRRDDTSEHKPSSVVKLSSDCTVKILRR